MRRRDIILGLAAAALAVAPAVAQSNLVNSVVAQLRAQGYAQIEVKRTWLGRIRIVAEKSGREREVVLNPNTGEILRDVWRRDSNLLVFDGDGDGDGDGNGDSGGNSGTGSSGDSGGGDDQDDDEDDPSDDDGNDDSGGDRGSGSSGRSGGGDERDEVDDRRDDRGDAYDDD